MRTLIFLACLIVLIYTQTSPPRYPDQFQQDLVEENKYSFLDFKTQGKFFYDYTNRRYRVDRENGKSDRYCGSVYKFTDTPCSHIVKEGKRYLYFSEKNDCCYCCDAAHGCGVLKPDWAIDAQFIETVTNANGVKLEKWNKRGGQRQLCNKQIKFFRITKLSILISQLKLTKCQITFKLSLQKSFYRGIRDPSVFDLPAGCSAEKTWAFVSICTPLRGRNIRTN